MISGGRRRISAPISSAATGIAVNGARTAATFRHGDSAISNSGNGAAAGATSVIVAANQTVGNTTAFAATQEIYVGYGTALQEEATISSVSGTTLTLTGATALTNTHPDGVRVVRKVTQAPYRPGSVVIVGDDTPNTSAVIAEDNGDGTLVAPATETDGGTFTSGTVDYNTGTVVVTMGTSAARTVTVQADTLTDAPAIDSPDGTGFQRNFQVMTLMRRDAPDAAVLTNGGDSEIGIYFETSVDGGQHFQFAGSGYASKVPAFARKTLSLPSGSGKQVVRMRCGADSAGASNELDVDTLYDISDNGQ